MSAMTGGSPQSVPVGVNGRFLFQGGTDGFIAPHALRRGYAVMSMDRGHHACHASRTSPLIHPILIGVQP